MGEGYYVLLNKIWCFRTKDASFRPEQEIESDINIPGKPVVAPSPCTFHTLRKACRKSALRLRATSTIESSAMIT